MATLVVGIFAVSAPGEAADSDCGPITLDMLFPGVDIDGNPTTTTTTTAPPTTTTTAHSSSTVTTQPVTTTTMAPLPEPCTDWVYEMHWPLGVQSRVFSGFGTERDGGARRHRGNDIVAPKLAPVVAVAAGVVTTVHNTPPDDCCWLMITHDDGWQSLYVHLNNDAYLGDDGMGHGVRPGLQVGSEVQAGEVIGWVGDSGNAEATVPHLHFELRHPEGYSVDPHSSLEAARSGLELPVANTPYLDLYRRPLSLPASSLVTAGIFWPCDDLGLFFCPDATATPEGVADLVGMMTGLDAPVLPVREQLVQLNRPIPERLLASVLGCTVVEDCMEAGITTGDLARLAYWANLSLRHQPDVDPTTDLRQTTLAEAELGLRGMGRITICDDPLDDARLVDRGEAMTLLTKWVMGVGIEACLTVPQPTS